ncbi:MAG: DoxX family protein [Alphaproteobacteria bacterium]|nr:DoxX family protein [Alphaproteobacteria bacterium]MBV8411612.1 DoxX family protein [Alphaproteobacteria bacterium]
MAIADIGSTWAPRVLSILRIMTGLLLLQHGTGKHLGFPPGIQVPNAWVSAAGYFELVGGILIVIGLFTRPVAFILCGMTAVAYFMAHAPQGFFPILNRGELAVLYCFVFLYIAAAGPGPWSIDATRRAA